MKWVLGGSYDTLQATCVLSLCHLVVGWLVCVRSPHVCMQAVASSLQEPQREPSRCSFLEVVLMLQILLLLPYMAGEVRLVFGIEVKRSAAVLWWSLDM